MQLQKKLRKGFTLIELLVVVAIIGLLASIVLVSVAGVRGRGRDARRKADLKNLQGALELYNNQLGAYPNCGGTFVVVQTGASAPACLQSTLVPNYIATLPTDPTNTAQLIYQYNSAGGTLNYKIMVQVEQGASDRDALNDGGTRNDYFELFTPGGQAL